MKEKIVITEEDIREIVKESVENVLDEMKTLYDYTTQSQPLVEMAKINKEETKGLFPYNKFDIQVWSNDHNPPHFHVICEGYDILFLIENGELYRVKKKGTNKKIYSYITKNIVEWLNQQSAVDSKNTNQEMARNIWKVMH